MNEHDSGAPRCANTIRLIRLIIAIVIFAVLIAIRTEFDATWLRVLVAACAGAVLGWGILQFTRHRR